MKTKLMAMLLAAGAALGLATVAVGASFNLDYMASARAKPAAKEKVSVAANVEEQLDDGVLRQIVIPTSVAPQLDDQLQVGDELDVTLFDDRALTLLLAEQTPSSDGVASFLATVDGYDGEFVAVVVQMDGRIQIDIQDYLAQRVYSVLSSEERTIVREMDPHQLPIVDAPAMEVSVQGAVMDNNSAEEPAVEHGTPPKESADSVSTPTVDILVAYDTDAAAWAKSNGGGLSGFAETQVQKMNTAIANTGLNSYFMFKLVGVYEIGYSAGGDISAALRTAYDANATLNGNSWSGLRAKRDEVEADIVCVLVDNGSSYGTTGIGNSLQSDSIGFSEAAYNATLIRAVSQGHTMTHEVGHNMGAGHAKEMASSLKPGPQYHDWSSGYYFYIGSTGYHTIMAYNYDGYGNSYQSVPYFSSPSYTYNSVAVGDATHDNTRTLRETYLETSKYRGGVVASALGTATETESYTWETSALYPWTRVTGTSYDGVDSARSGSESPNTWMRTRVVGPATLTFYYKMYSYGGSFEVTCDNSSLFSRKNEIVSGSSFTKVTASIPAGTHVVKFGYTRSDYYYSTDGVWVDQITFSGGSPAVDTYTVTYKPGSNGSGSQQTATKTKDVALTLKGSIFTRTGYAQTGWATSDGGAKAYSLGASYTANAAITLYPYWTANTYTVTLDRQNGSGGTASVTATYDSAMPSITVPTRSGYTFGGYYTSTGGGGTQYYTASGASARSWDKTSATTLYAKWTSSSPTTYTVTYKPGSNGTGSQQTATKTKDVALTLKGSIFTRTGYAQTGWSTSDGGSKSYNLGASYTANAAITLYPYWTANTYTVTLDRQNGSGGTASVTATYGSAMPSITKPTRSGYTFGGYFTATGGSGTQYYTASGASARNWDKTSATTLYAKWTSSGPANDSFSSPTTISGASGSTSGSSVGATMQTSETKPSAQSNSGASVWYKWTAPSSGTATFDTIGSGFDTVLAVYTGTSVSSLTEVASDDDGGGSSGNTSKLTFQAVAGTTYRIAIYGYDGATGSFNLRWSTSSSGPANDSFSSPTTISGASGSTSGSSVGATMQTSEPKPSDQSDSGASVWYKWTAPSSGMATFDTIGSGYDTVLAVYTGSSVSSLAEVASDDDGGGSGSTSKLTFQADAGTTYRIAIYGYNGATGSFNLRWSISSSGPANDSFSSPTTISGTSGSTSGSSVGATMQTSETKPSAQSYSGASVWYVWTAPDSGTATFDTIGSDFDTVLAVYTGSSVSSLAEVASDDDGGGSYTSKLSFQADAGTTYRIAVYGYGGDTGSLVLRWSLEVPPPAPAPCYVVVNGADIVAPYAAEKAVTLMGAAYDGCDVVGIVELKLGKVNARKGTSKVSGSVTTLDGKKHVAKAVTVTGIDGTASAMVSLEVKDVGVMEVVVGGMQFAGTLGGVYHVQSADVGGAWAGGSAVVTVWVGDLSAFSGTVLADLLPVNEVAAASGTKWSFAKAAGVKWAKPMKGAPQPGIYDAESGKGLIVDTSGGKTNLSGLKLTYTPKKGTFKGSFSVYALEGAGKSTKLKKYKVNVGGVVVDGVGYGMATCKNPAVAWPVAVEE